MKGVRRATRMVATTVTGAVLLVAGLVMLVTPGPGLLAVAAGLAVLAREFAWARRLLDRVRVRLTQPRFRRRERRPAIRELDAAAPHHGPGFSSEPHGHRHVA